MIHITPPSSKHLRDSNLELLRVLAMLAIIAHHYVVNSGVASNFTYSGTTPQQYFLEAWGLWGKSSINSFVLISGYFLCRMQLTWQRYAKLLFEVVFYGVVIMLIFVISGYQDFSINGLIRRILSPLYGINRGFTASFLCFYAFVPFYNILINHCSRRQLFYLICGLLTVISGCATLFMAPTMNEPLWYMTIYLVAAYIRNYPNRFTESLKFSSILLMVSIVVALIINISSIYLSNVTGNMTIMHLRRYLLIDSNMPLSFIVGVAAFLTFKNLPRFHSRIINFLAAGTFGVLLIHASSDTMRRWLWVDVCNVRDMINAPMTTLIFQAISVPVVIFLVCSLIDCLRRQFVEKPLFLALNKRISQTNGN